MPKVALREVAEWLDFQGRITDDLHGIVNDLIRVAPFVRCDLVVRISGSTLRSCTA
jgi:hypothetical protein